MGNIRERVSKETAERVSKIKREAEEQVARLQAAADAKIKLIEEQARANAERREAEDALRKRLERDHGMTTHPKRDLLWSKAWEHGHSDGLSQVEIWYDDLAELLETG